MMSIGRIVPSSDDCVFSSFEPSLTFLSVSYSSITPLNLHRDVRVQCGINVFWLLTLALS